LRIGLLGEVIELAVGNVGFDPLVPRICHEILELLSESLKVRLRQTGNF
jgi:hypothetical protein